MELKIIWEWFVILIKPNFYKLKKIIVWILLFSKKLAASKEDTVNIYPRRKDSIEHIWLIKSFIIENNHE